MKTIAILPVKRFDSAYSRLSDRLTQEQRRRVAEATFLDMLGKIRRSKTVSETIVVTSDQGVARQSGWLGHHVVREDEDRGHSEAAAKGVRAALERGADRVAMLPTDCPLFDPAELDDRLGVTPRYALIVPDRAGTGTNALILCPPDAFEPAFGLDSCARHIAHARAAGVNFALERLESLATDLDSPEDMELLRDALLLEPDRSLRTAQVLWEVGAAPQPSPPRSTPPEAAAAA
jgi:2-phospho-L-lactate/phosphoenolpyruvate guanylyltransferase